MHCSPQFAYITSIILTTFVWSRYYYFSHFTEAKTEEGERLRNILNHTWQKTQEWIKNLADSKTCFYSMIYGLLFKNVVKILHKHACLVPAPAYLWQGPINPVGVARPSSFPSSEVRIPSPSLLLFPLYFQSGIFLILCPPCSEVSKRICPNTC